MNACVPDWYGEEEDGHGFSNGQPTARNQRKFMREDQELMELLWQNDHIVIQNRKTGSSMNESKQQQPSEPKIPLQSAGASTNSNMFEEEKRKAEAWLQYSLDDALDSDIDSGFFQGMPIGGGGKLERDAALTYDQSLKPGIIEDVEQLQIPTPKQSKSLTDQNLMPPPKSHYANSIVPKPHGIVNFSQFSISTRLVPACTSGPTVKKTPEPNNHGRKEAGIEPVAAKSKLSASCGSNQMQNQLQLLDAFTHVKFDDFDPIIRPVEDAYEEESDKGPTETRNTLTWTSSSAGSGSSAGKVCPYLVGHKRKKTREANDSDSQSKEMEYQSVEEGKASQKSKAARRSRAAQVHNLSERKRRDRINEKMKALQELIPNCNKTDKASMLDEAIDYLKSLQLQVQMMWMGNGMAQMMLQSAQHYLPFIGMIPPVRGALQIPWIPFASQAMSASTTACKLATNPFQPIAPTSHTNQEEQVRMFRPPPS